MRCRDHLRKQRRNQHLAILIAFVLAVSPLAYAGKRADQQYAATHCQANNHNIGGFPWWQLIVEGVRWAVTYTYDHWNDPSGCGNSSCVGNGSMDGQGSGGSIGGGGGDAIPPMRK